MSIKKPYYRTYRPQIDWPNSVYNSWIYIIDKKYSILPEHYTRAYKIIQEDLMKLFEYVEPSDKNLETYSYRIHELFMRTCIEIEANFKAILKENWYNPLDKKNKPIKEKYWNINNYYKVNGSHFLDRYSIEIPIWNWEKKVFKPFYEWSKHTHLNWYTDYNNSKHDRHNNFQKANLENLLNAVSWLLILLSSQFRTENFSPWTQSLGVEWYNYYSWIFWIWNYLIINFPNYKENEKYNFDREKIKKDDNIFNKYIYK